MPRAGSKSPVSTGDIRRMTAAVQKTGLKVNRIEIDVKSGRFSFVTSQDGSEIEVPAANEWDAALKTP